MIEDPKYHYCNETLPCMYEDERGQLFYFPYKYESFLGIERWFLQRHVQEAVYLLMTNYWSYSILISLCYALAVHVIKWAMTDRKAFDLRIPLIVWNSALAVFSIVGTIRIGEEFVHVVTKGTLLDSISYAYDPKQAAVVWGFLFTVSKVFELVDTLFVLLRKKPLLFLHWYHHAVVLVIVCHGCKEMTGGSRWYVLMNYAVHTLMYSYYAITAAGFRFPRVVSMTLTSLQTIQMFIGVTITFIVFYYKTQGRIMQQTYENLFLGFALYVSFAVLFSDFFSKSYLTEKKEKAKSA